MALMQVVWQSESLYPSSMVGLTGRLVKGWVLYLQQALSEKVLHIWGPMTDGCVHERTGKGREVTRFSSQILLGHNG